MRGRLAEWPACLREVAARVAASPPVTRPVFVTGIGGSEGPARAMAELLRAHAGARASFLPLSAFAQAIPGSTDAALVVFSQSLSPNARLALARAPEFAAATLFTSTHDDPAVRRFDKDGGQVLVLPPTLEQGALVRVIGPCAAMFAAALHTGAASSTDLDPLLLRLSDAAAVPSPLASMARVAFVTAGGYGELCRAAKNVWLEALCAPEPPMWDVLEVAHGPFQEFFDSEITLIALERPGDESALFDRLARMLVAPRHSLVRLCSPLSRALAPIDHLAQVVDLVCRRLAESPRDLSIWPGRGLDAPLYSLGTE